MKKINFAALIVLCAIICLSFLSSCSKSSIDAGGKIVDNDTNTTVAYETTIQHNWQEERNNLLDNAISSIKWISNGVQETSFTLPANIEWKVEEVLRKDTTFSSSSKSVSVEKKNAVKTTQDSTIFSLTRTREEKYGETTITMNLSWMNGTLQVGNEELNLAYVRLDSVVSFPNLTEVKKIAEDGELKKYTFSMPHKAYYTAKTTRGEERISKGFKVNGTFLYQETANNDEPTPEQPTTPENPSEKAFVDATVLSRRFNMEEQKSYITLNCQWSDDSSSTLEVWVSMPYGWSFPAEKTVQATTEGPSKFEKLIQDSNPEKTSYTLTSETNLTAEVGKVTRRKVSRKTLFKFSDFEEVLTSFHHEANLVVNGKTFTFLSPAESISAGKNEQETSKNGNTSVEKNTVNANILFNQQNFHAAGIVNVLREESGDAGIEIDSAYGTITGVMGVTRVCEMSSKSPVWHTCVTFKTSKGQIRVIDETTVSFMSFEEAYDDDRMFSGAYNNGTLYPALISIDSTGWTYLAETKSGISFAVEMSDQLALNSGIKNFAKNNSAKPTPIVEYSHSKNNGTWTVSYKIAGQAKTVTVK